MILNYLNDLAATSKRNEKIEILEDIKDRDDVEMFKRVVFMAYDPSLNYWVREFDSELSPSHDRRGELSLEKALDALEHHIGGRQVTGNDAIARVELIFRRLSVDDAEVFKRVVNRDLRCGVGAKTFNKVFPDLIYVHPYMRCASFNAKNLKNVQFPCYSQVKMDGLYVDIIVDGDDVVYMSRNGKVLDFNHPDTDSYFAVFHDGVYMGEAVALDESGEIMDRSKSNGYLNSDDVDPKRLSFYLWDVVSYNDFTEKKSNTRYKDRFETLPFYVTRVSHSRINLVDSKFCKDAEDVKEHAVECVARGEEGTVIKDMSMIWKDGENKLQVKIKPDFEVDLKVVDYKMGKGRNEGVLGALVCRTGDDLLEVSVGTGYSDEAREKLLQDVESMVADNAVVAVKANDIITNENKPDMYSLFLPRFLKIRKDKDQADTLARVREQKNSYEDALDLIGRD